MDMKTCTKCNEEKPMKDFSLRDGAKDGKNPWCRDCQSEHQREYYRKKKAKNLNNK